MGFKHHEFLDATSVFLSVYVEFSFEYVNSYSAIYFPSFFTAKYLCKNTLKTKIRELVQNIEVSHLKVCIIHVHILYRQLAAMPQRIGYSTHGFVNRKFALLHSVLLAVIHVHIQDGEGSVLAGVTITMSPPIAFQFQFSWSET